MIETICILCPKGCRLRVNMNNQVSGHFCSRGEVYALKEISHPERIVPSTIRIKGSRIKRLPVKTDRAIPKEMIFKIMEVLNGIEVEAPINLGDIIIFNVLDTGVNIVATRSVEILKLNDTN